MNIDILLKKALNLEALSVEESVFLYKNAVTSELMYVGHELRKKHKTGDIVSYIIDRNINITNVCISGCQFCNFYRSKNSKEAYITCLDEYFSKIDELYSLGGNQLLLQGGLHPELGLKFYTDLFKEIKCKYPDIKLHSLSPTEIVYLSERENLNYEEILIKLIDSGLDSLPGGGAEILSDRVRKIISKNKCTSSQWLDVMKVAHKLNMITTATMMFGHIETIEERFIHLELFRNLQSEKSENSIGFISFTPWTFQDEGTTLSKIHNIKNAVTINEYIRMIAMSRIFLNNIDNIQASWLTVGKQTAQLCLHAGANDFSSIMIEEHVVSAAGANNTFDVNSIEEAIREAGFIPKRRDQKYNYK